MRRWCSMWGARLMAGLVTVMCATSTATAETRDPEPANGLERAVQQIEELKAKRVEMQVAETSLVRVIDVLRDVHGLSIRADWAELDHIGVSERSRVSLRLRETSAWELLQALSLQLGDQFDRARVETMPGEVVITTSAATRRMQFVDVYAIGDLLRADDARMRLIETAPGAMTPPVDEAEDDRETSPPAADSENPDDDDSGDAGVDADAGEPVGSEDSSPPPSVERTPAEALVSLILEHVDPEAWLRYGGSRARVTEQDSVVLISAPATIHVAFREALEALRFARPRVVSLDLACVEVPAALWETTSRRMRPSMAAFARAILTSPDAVVHWRGGGVVSPGEAFETHGGGLTLSAQTALMPESAELEVKLRAKITTPWEAGVNTTVRMPVRGGAACLRIPGEAGSDSADRIRVLVMVPIRG